MAPSNLQTSICETFGHNSELKSKVRRRTSIKELLELLEETGNTVLNTQSLDTMMKALTDYCGDDELSAEIDKLAIKKEDFETRVHKFSKALSLEIPINRRRTKSVKCIVKDKKAVEKILIDVSVLVIESFSLNHGISATVEVPDLIENHVAVVFSLLNGDVMIGVVSKNLKGIAPILFDALTNPLNINIEDEKVHNE